MAVYRDVFHRFLVDEDLSSTDRETARSFVEQKLKDTKILLRKSDILPDYESNQFDEWIKRIYDQNYAALEKSKTNGIVQAWFSESKEALYYLIRQFAPLELTASGWWRSNSTTGTFSKSKSALFQVLYDIIGRGKLSEHFSNNYLELLKSLGISVPPLETQLFSDYNGFTDEAFMLPATLLAISLYSKTFMPEIMGMVMHQEIVRVPTYLAVAEVLENWGMPSFFFRKRAYSKTPHLSGRGAYAILAIKELMKETGQSKEIWERIMTGFVLAGQLAISPSAISYESQKCQHPREKFRKLLEVKGPIASTAHGKTTLANKSINHHFLDDSNEFLKALEISHWVVPANFKLKGNPEKSPFITYLLSFDGPMYQVFNEEEINIIKLWILSLKVTPFTQVYSLLITKSQTTKDGNEISVASMISHPLELMHGFKRSGWCDQVNSKLLQECDQNGAFHSLISESELAIIRQWIDDGAPTE